MKWLEISILCPTKKRFRSDFVTPIFFVAGRDECVTYPINYLQGGREYLATDKSQSQTKKLLVAQEFFILQLAAVVAGGFAGDAFEVLTHKGWVRKVELVGDLLDGQIGVFEQILYLEHDKLVNPLMDRLSRVVANNSRQMFRGEIHLVCVKFDTALGAVMLVQQAHKLLKIVATAVL